MISQRIADAFIHGKKLTLANRRVTVELSLPSELIVDERVIAQNGATGSYWRIPFIINPDIIDQLNTLLGMVENSETRKIITSHRAIFRILNTGEIKPVQYGEWNRLEPRK